MAETTKKRVGELERGVFKILIDKPDGLAAKEVLAQVERLVPPTDFEKTDYPNRPGVRRFEKTVRFATIVTVRAGWLVKSKGQWTVTDEGKKAYTQFTDPTQFRDEAVKLYRLWKDQQPDASPDIEVEGATATGTLEEAEESAWAEIEHRLKSIPPFDFQKLVAALLRAMGYSVSYVAPPGPDKGVDIVAHNDPLGTSVPRIKVQVKRQEPKVTVDGLRSFMALLGDQDVGIFVCTGGFTNDAASEARSQQNRKVTLLDLENLFDLWVEYYNKVAESEKQLLPLRPVYYLAPSE